MSDLDWNEQLTDQLTFHWEHQLRARLEGLTDAEYFWEPVPGAWNLHVGGGGHTPTQFGSEPVTIDFAYPEPVPAPVTTIAWRLAHIIVGCFGMRVASHFGGPPLSYETFPYAATAREALEQLDAGYAAWLAGVRSWSDADLAEPVGPAEGPFAALPRSTLVLHIQREVIHHGAEIALLRDLWANGLR